jgi:hypothetical protein
LDKNKEDSLRHGILFGREQNVNTKVTFQKKWHLAQQVLFLLLISLFILIQSYEAKAEEKLSPRDKQRLLAYINTYESTKFIADPKIKPQLERLLGQELNHLKNNINVRWPIGVISGILFVSGSAPHLGGEENGFVGIDLNDGAVYAALLTEGKIKVYGKSTMYHSLPDGVRDWILMTWADASLDGKAPPNVELHPSP